MDQQNLDDMKAAIEKIRASLEWRNEEGKELAYIMISRPHILSLLEAYNSLIASIDARDQDIEHLRSGRARLLQQLIVADLVKNGLLEKQNELLRQKLKEAEERGALASFELSIFKGEAVHVTDAPFDLEPWERQDGLRQISYGILPDVQPSVDVQSSGGDDQVHNGPEQS